MMNFSETPVFTTVSANVSVVYDKEKLKMMVLTNCALLLLLYHQHQNNAFQRASFFRKDFFRQNLIYCLLRRSDLASMVKIFC